MGMTVLLAAGGTGGHVFPAIATAEELHKRGHKVAIATDSRTAHYNFPDWCEVKVLGVKTLSGGLTAKVTGGLALVKSIAQAQALMQKINPDVVVGYGGYPSFPVIAMAMARRLPIVLHEQNRYLGKVNRFAASKAKTIALSVPDTKGIKQEDEAKAILVGNPARPEVNALRSQLFAAPQPQEKLNLLIFAGSQGARSFSEVVPAAIGKLPPELRLRLNITQQCREEDIEQVRADYLAYDMRPEIKPFFDDMPHRIASSHLVLCRSGASTITEMMVIGRPAIYVPLAIAADDHQTHNAQYIEEHNAGWLLPSSLFEVSALAARLEYCLSHTEILAKTAKAAYDLAKPTAAGALAEAVLNANLKMKTTNI